MELLLAEATSCSSRPLIIRPQYSLKCSRNAYQDIAILAKSVSAQQVRKRPRCVIIQCPEIKGIKHDRKPTLLHVQLRSMYAYLPYAIVESGGGRLRHLWSNESSSHSRTSTTAEYAQF